MTLLQGDDPKNRFKNNHMNKFSEAPSEKSLSKINNSQSKMLSKKIDKLKERFESLQRKDDSVTNLK